ncbi:unnamed protein product [Alternaria sp. RS040]
MDHQRMSDWQMQPWNEDTIDPSWFSNFLATDPGQDAPNAASGAPAAFSVDDDLAIDPNFHDFTFENTSQPMSTVTSPSHPFDAFQLNETHGRPLVQRQHTLPRRRSKYFKRRSTGTASPIAIPGGSPRHEEGQSLAIQRWRNSPPEDEAASLSAIYHALEDRPRIFIAIRELEPLRHVTVEASQSGHQNPEGQSKRHQNERPRAYLQMYILLRYVQAQVRLDTP